MTTFSDLQKIYGGKRVFLTGHTGFKGSWLTVVLNLMGAVVKGYSLDADDPSIYRAVDGDTLCESYIHDIRDRETLSRELTNFQPDFVFHLAAQALVKHSYTHPVETYETNVLGTLNVLDAIRDLDNPCIGIMITTDKVYENLETNRSYKEEDKLGGYDPYSSSKACAEIASISFRRSFFDPGKYDIHQKAIATARAGNVIGGGDWATDRIIPDLIRAFDKQETLMVRNPSSIRPWQHVLEPLSGYLQLGRMLTEDPIRYADCFNFGPLPEDEIQVHELIERAITIWGSGDYITPEIAELPHEATLLRLDITKARKVLGWEPRYDSATALTETIEWYKKYQEDPLGITVRQIRRYLGD